MRIGSLFSGIGGLELGLEWSGIGHTIWQVEQNDYARRILEQHWPNATRHRDVREVGAHNLEPVDLICGGFPCQDVSAAGSGAGLAGHRSGLWREFARIVGELEPEWVVVENVASGAKRWVDAVVSELGGLGYATLPIPLTAADAGAPHRRARVFLVAKRVPDTDGQSARNGPEREPGRRSGGLRHEGQPQPQTMGDRGGIGRAPRMRTDEARQEEHRAPTGASREVRGVADGDRRGQQGERKQECARVEGQAGAKPDGRGSDTGLIWPPGPLDDAGWGAYVSRGGPEPALLRGADGVPRRMDRSDNAKAWRRQHRERLKALGNSVVPQCAEVVGWVIRELGTQSSHSQ